MNKEEIEDINKKLETTEDDTVTINLLYQKVELLESILDKVTDKLKEDIEKFNRLRKTKEMYSPSEERLSSKYFYTQEILNIIEGEK